MADPRKEKKFLMKIFGGDRDVSFLMITSDSNDEAVAEGSMIPDELAFIRFREVYQETDTGWMRL